MFSWRERREMLLRLFHPFLCSVVLLIMELSTSQFGIVICVDALSTEISHSFWLSLLTFLLLIVNGKETGLSHHLLIDSLQGSQLKAGNGDLVGTGNGKGGTRSCMGA